MIAKLKGELEYFQDNYAIVMISGIGYKVYLSAYTVGKIAGKKEVEFHIHTHVREDTLALYGFLDKEELKMFELLIAISGIGPKAALSVLSIATPQTIRTAILNEDSSLLTKVSGIGKKTAERIILELKNKVADLSEKEKENATIDSDAIEALLTMGYTVSEAREALKIVPLDVKDVGARVKIALRNLGKK